MARKAMATTESVTDAAEALVSEGVKVTAAAVRTKIGGGSYTTILPLIAAWEEAQKDRTSLKDIEVPDAMVVHGEELIARIWRDAVATASAGHDGIRRKLVEAQDKTKAVRDELTEIVQDTETGLKAAQGELAALRSEREELVAQTLSDKIELARLAERVAALTERANAAEQRTERAEDRADRAEARADRTADTGKADGGNGAARVDA